MDFIDYEEMFIRCINNVLEPTIGLEPMTRYARLIMTISRGYELNMITAHEVKHLVSYLNNKFIDTIETVKE